MFVINLTIHGGLRLMVETNLKLTFYRIWIKNKKCCTFSAI